MIRKVFFVGRAVVLAMALIGGAALWWMIQQPLYRPGMVREGQGLGASLEPPPQDGDPERWTVEPGVELHHFAQGEGRTVMIVHGGPGVPTLDPWPGLAPLAGRYRFIYYDQRGSERSTRPFDRMPAGSTYEQIQLLDRHLGLGAQIADIERIRRVLGEERLLLIGHSFGGFLATLYAAEFPERVAGLVLVAPAQVLVLPNPDGDIFAQIAARLPAERRAEFDQWLARYLDFGTLLSLDEQRLAALNAEFGAYYEAASGERMPPGGTNGGWMAQALYLSMGQRHDYRGALGQISAPTLVIHGADDLQPEAASRQYRDLIPGATLVVIPGAGHAPFYTHPDAFAAAIQPLLE